MSDKKTPPVTTTSGTDKRCETRYPCLGLGILYSPAANAVMEGVGADLFRAQLHDMSISGISIDVEQSYAVGTSLRLCVAESEQQREMLQAEVKWCEQLADDAFRLGLLITHYEGVEAPCIHAVNEGCYRKQKITVPTEIHMSCPACKAQVRFQYRGEQQGFPHRGQVPLYNCPQCETTRAITSILFYNRYLK